MKRNPLISIITPSFNQSEYLEETIKSVLFQDYSNIEYIIIDGGSNDDSTKIITAYQDRLAYWHSKPDNGQSNAINQGFRRARGDIVCWLNADDLYMPGTLRKIADLFYKLPDIDFIYGDCVYIDEEGSFVRYFTECERYNRNRLLNFHDFISQPTAFFSKKKLSEVGMLDESFQFAMDWELWCRFAKADANFLCLFDVLSANRDHSSTKTSRGGLNRIMEIWRVQKLHRESVWPHALFGFLATEVVKIGDRNDNYFLKYFLKWIGRSISIVSPQAKWYWWNSGSLKEARYGLYPNSTKTDGIACIQIPYFNDRKWNSIIISAGIDGKSRSESSQTKVKIELNDESIAEMELGPNNLKNQIKISIGKEPRILNKIILTIKFERNDVPVKGHLYGVHLSR